MDEPKRGMGHTLAPLVADGPGATLASTKLRLEQLEAEVEQLPPGPIDWDLVGELHKLRTTALRLERALETEGREELTREQLAELASEAAERLRPAPEIQVPNAETWDELEILAAEWARAGAALFRGPTVPSRAEVIFAAKRVVLLALVRKGVSITAAAARCKTSRRALRDSMRLVGVYQAPTIRTIDWESETDLGKVPDSVVAKRLHCSPSAVARARRVRGIPAYQKGQVARPCTHDERRARKCGRSSCVTCYPPTAEQWNAAHPVGTKVLYRSHSNASPLETSTRSAAWALGHGEAVVMVEGVSGCVALWALEVCEGVRGIPAYQKGQVDRG